MLCGSNSVAHFPNIMERRLYCLYAIKQNNSKIQLSVIFLCRRWYSSAAPNTWQQIQEVFDLNSNDTKRKYNNEGMQSNITTCNHTSLIYGRTVSKTYSREICVLVTEKRKSQKKIIKQQLKREIQEYIFTTILRWQKYWILASKSNEEVKKTNYSHSANYNSGGRSSESQ